MEKICHFLDAKRPVKRRERERGREERRWRDSIGKARRTKSSDRWSDRKTDSFRAIKSDRNQRRNLSVRSLANLFFDCVKNKLVSLPSIRCDEIDTRDGKIGRVQLYLSREKIKVIRFENVSMEFFFSDDRKGKLRSKYSAVSISNKFQRPTVDDEVYTFSKVSSEKATCIKHLGYDSAWRESLSNHNFDERFSYIDQN